VQFINVYVREAHPTDGWRMSSNDKDGVAIAQPTTDAERSEAAAQCCAAIKMTVPLVVDKMDDRVGHLYSGMPDRLYLIDRSGKVAYKGGRGPFGFKPQELEQQIAMMLGEDKPAIDVRGRFPVLSNEAAWAKLPDMRDTPVEVSLTLLESLHARWSGLLSSLSDKDFERTFNHPEHGVRSLDWLLALYSWHGQHHVAHITSTRQRMGW